MMRLRVLELPTVVDGDRVETPFVLVLDGVSESAAREIQADAPEILDGVRDATGARGLILFADRIDLGD